MPRHERLTEATAVRRIRQYIAEHQGAKPSDAVKSDPRLSVGVDAYVGSEASASGGHEDVPFATSAGVD
jgi:hypothetical protein